MQEHQQAGGYMDVGRGEEGSTNASGYMDVAGTNSQDLGREVSRHLDPRAVVIHGKQKVVLDLGDSVHKLHDLPD